MTEDKKNDLNEKEEEPFRVRSKVECLYVFLEQLRQEGVQYALDVNFWQKRILKESNPANLRNLEIELNQHTEKKREAETRIRITKSMIDEEKNKLSQEELAEILKYVKPRSEQDMVRNSIDFFTMATVPLEVNLRFWQSRLLEQTHPEVKVAIETGTIPEFKRGIELSNGGRASAEAYLQTLEKEAEEKKQQVSN